MKLNTLFKNLFYILLLTATTLNAKVTYTHTDALGSVIAESDESGKVIKSYHYAPYGESIPSVKNNNPGYTGHVYDNDLGLSYMIARYYDPEIGRFYSNDPVGFSADNTFSFNRYVYANNNPYKFVDPDGEHPLLIFVAVAALTSYLNAPDVGQQPMSGMTPEAEATLSLIPVEMVFFASSKLLTKIGTKYKFSKESKIIHGTLTKSQQKHFNKIDEIQHNVDVRKSLTGDNLDIGHITKLNNHRIGLNKSINGLKNSLKNPNLNDASKAIINNKVTQAQNIVNKIDDLIGH